VNIVTRPCADGPGFESWHGQVFILCSETSRPCLGFTQPSVQWLPAFFPGSKQQGREFNHLSPSSNEVKNEWSCPSNLPACLRRAHRERFTFYYTRYCNKSFLYFSNTQY